MRKFAIVFILLCFQSCAVAPATAQEYQGEPSRFFWLNDESCPEGYRDYAWRFSMDMWDFYSEPELYEVENRSTVVGKNQDFQETTSCMTEEQLKEEEGDNVAAVTYTWIYQDTQIVAEADQVFRMDYAQNDNNGQCAALHEMGHALGLAISDDPISIMVNEWLHGHPADPDSVMYHQVGCLSNFLTMTDLLLVAESYDVPANCTPYVQADFSIYFPYVGGWEAELQYEGQGEWSIAWFAPAKEGDWECNLSMSGKRIQGTFYDATRNTTYQQTLDFSHGRFREPVSYPIDWWEIYYD